MIRLLDALTNLSGLGINIQVPVIYFYIEMTELIRVTKIKPLTSILSLFILSSPLALVVCLSSIEKLVLSLFGMPWLCVRRMGVRGVNMLWGRLKGKKKLAHFWSKQESIKSYF